ncbi:MAG: flagellar biosynthesis protein FlhA [Myxococcota bacterium]
MTAPVPAGSSTRAEQVVAACVLAVLAILVLPVPPAALDVLLALNIGVAVVILLVALRVRQPLEFSAFPTLLLIVTLFRLGLNVATTRLILSHGSQGVESAGAVIATFGKFAVGGSLVVGLVVFLILIVVNFTVITKGSNRISEVAARFTLDAMPGKQMAIDADLAAGIINEQQARERRTTLEQEAEFFGAMDGASKFVRGDAVAGLIITAINIVGGLAAGLLRDHLSLAQASATYTILTIGDGLVSQIPALLISTAAGIVTTRSGERTGLGVQVGRQVLGEPQVMQSTAAVLLGMGLLPGMPLLAFAGLAGAALLAARRTPADKAAAVQAEARAARGKDEPERIQDLLALDTLEVQVGAGLLSLIDVDRGGELPGRITSLRKQVAQETGVVLPSVHLKDNLALDSTTYRVLLRGQELGRGVVHADRLMALDGGAGAPDIDGIAAVEPAFGLPARWITRQQRVAAEAKGLTVVDPASVLTTHLGELLRHNAHELVGRQEVQELVAQCSREAPKLVEATVPSVVTLGELVAVVRGLLREGISVRDFRTILEAVADAAVKSKDPAHLVEHTRRRLARQITSRLKNDSGRIKVLTLSRKVEESLRGSLVAADGELTLAPDVETARSLLAQLERASAQLAAQGLPTVVLAPADLRRPFFEFAARFHSELWVICARELLPGTALDPAAVLEPELALR